MTNKTIEEQDKIKEFVLKAAECFANNKNTVTFTLDDIKAGCLFAVRWGLFGDCIIVFRLCEDFDPVRFDQVIERDKGFSEKAKEKLEQVATASITD